MWRGQGFKKWHLCSKNDFFNQKMSLFNQKCHFWPKKRRLRPLHTQKNIFFQKKRRLRPDHTRKNIFFQKKGACGLITHEKNIFKNIDISKINIYISLVCLRINNPTNCWKMLLKMDKYPKYISLNIKF